jgi:hypothetical protein
MSSDTRNGALQWLLLLLACMIFWRSTSSANALAAAICLLAMGLSVNLGHHFANHNWTHWLAHGWLWGGLLNAVLALGQYFGFTAEPVGTAFGFLRQRNQMATLCTTALIALMYLQNAQTAGLQDGVRSGWRALTHYVPVMGAAMLLCSALAATCSRTGFLQLVFACAGSFALASKTNLKHRGQLALMACVFIACYALAAWALPQLSRHPETVMTRVLDAADTKQLQINDSRRPLWDNTRSLIEANPLLGVGWRELAYSLHMTDFGSSARFHAQADHTHNIVLQFAAELGVPFTVLWFSLLAYWLWKAKPWQAQHPDQLLGWGVIAVIAIHSLLEYPLWYAPFQIALGLALGLISRTTAAQGLTSGLAVTRWLGAGLVLFCSYAAFDYHRMSQLFLSTDKRAEIYQTNTMAKAEGSWLFANQVRFAKLLTTPVTEANAKEMWALGQQVIHFSPEPRVFKVLIAAGEFLEATDTSIAAELAVLKRQLALIER